MAGGGAARIFVALQPPPEVARALADAVRGALAGEGSLRTVPAEHLHVTLVFLGDVERTRIPAVEQAVARAVEGALAPRLRLRGTGAFPRLERPRVLWAGLVEEPGSSGRIAPLQARIASALAGAGFDVDASEAWSPHVTVARPRGAESARAPAAFRELRLDLAWAPDRVLLIESRLDRPVPERYSVLSAHALAADAGER